MSWNYLLSRNQKTVFNLPCSQGGFGLVELMVSISIMVIVASIVLTRQSSFNGAVLLRGQAYEIALQLREIQLSAVSASSDGIGNFRSVLGVHFDSSTLINDKYSIFRDADSDGFFDSNEAFGLQGLLDKRFEIREIRTIGATEIAVPRVSIVFVRPNFDARFFTASEVEPVNVSGIEIDIARKGVTGTGDSVLRTIEITSTGQIAVQ